MLTTKGGKGKKERDKKVAKEVSLGKTDDPETRNVKGNKPVNLSTFAKDPLASQDKRTNEDKSTDNTEKETTKNSASTIVSLLMISSPVSVLLVPFLLLLYLPAHPQSKHLVHYEPHLHHLLSH